MELKHGDYNTGLIYTDEKRCIDCNKCIHECPVLTSNVSALGSDGKYKMCVDEHECILCGTCIDTCIHDVRHYRDDCESFISELKQGKELSVLVAPAFYFNYSKQSGNVLGYLKSLGVKNFYPVSFGADIAIWGYLGYLTKEKTKGIVTQPCPCIVSHIEKHQPELLGNIAPIQSPMMCTAIYLKKYLGIEGELAFLSPCIAKKVEIQSKRGLGLIRHNITFKGLMEHIESQGVDLGKYYNDDGGLNSGMGSLFPQPGGFKENIAYYLGPEASVIQVEGEQRVYNYLKTFALRSNKQMDLPVLVDVLNCHKGCSFGTGTDTHCIDDNEVALKAIAMRKEKYYAPKNSDHTAMPSHADRLAWLNETFKNLNLEDFMCEYENNHIPHNVTDAEIEVIFAEKLQKLTDNDQHMNCSACGYKTCRDMAEAIALGINHHGNCVYYVKNSLALHIKELQREEKLRERIEFENETKTRFLTQMSHEIRTPLNAVLSVAEIALMKKHLAEDDRDSFERIHRSGGLLLGLINDILDLSKVAAGKMELLLESYDSLSMIADTVQLNTVYFGDKNIELRLEIDENLPLRMIGDELRIKQIMNNVLSNAFKYSDAGVVVLAVRTEKAPDLYGDSVLLVIQVSDTGVGMTEDQISALFDEFVRFDLQRNRNIEGAGLGMPLTYMLTKLMHGDIEVESKPGVGTTVTVYIPQKVDGVQVLGRDAAIEMHNINRLKKHSKAVGTFVCEPMPYGRVLVVDDVESNLHVAKGFLQAYKIDVDTAEGGQEAIDKIKAGELYDIIFMDHMMPGLDGIRATKMIKDMGYDLPIVALTANAIKGQEDYFLELGFDGFISKPIVLKQLDSYLIRIIRDKQPAELVEATRKEYGLSTVMEQIDKNRITDSFLSDSRKILKLLESVINSAELDEGTINAYTIRMHGIKSALQNMDYKRLSKHAYELEKAGAIGNLALIKAKTLPFYNHLRDVVKTIEQQAERAQDDSEVEDEAFVHGQLLAIHHACAVFDIDEADHAIAELRQNGCSKQTKELLKEIERCLLRGNFEEAKNLANVKHS